MCTRIIREHAENICLAIRDFLFQFEEQTPFERAPLFAPYEDYTDKDEVKSDKPVFEQELKEIVVIRDTEPVVTESQIQTITVQEAEKPEPAPVTPTNTNEQIVSYFENLEKPAHQPLTEPIENPIVFQPQTLVINKPIYVTEDDDWDMID
jgi:hypothetical protein